MALIKYLKKSGKITRKHTADIEEEFNLKYALMDESSQAYVDAYLKSIDHYNIEAGGTKRTQEKLRTAAKQAILNGTVSSDNNVTISNSRPAYGYYTATNDFGYRSSKDSYGTANAILYDYTHQTQPFSGNGLNYDYNNTTSATASTTTSSTTSGPSTKSFTPSYIFSWDKYLDTSWLTHDASYEDRWDLLMNAFKRSLTEVGEKQGKWNGINIEDAAEALALLGKITYHNDDDPTKQKQSFKQLKVVLDKIGVTNPTILRTIFPIYFTGEDPNKSKELKEKEKKEKETISKKDALRNDGYVEVEIPEWAKERVGTNKLMEKAGVKYWFDENYNKLDKSPVENYLNLDFEYKDGTVNKSANYGQAIITLSSGLVLLDHILDWNSVDKNSPFYATLLSMIQAQFDKVDPTYDYIPYNKDLLVVGEDGSVDTHPLYDYVLDQLYGTDRITKKVDDVDIYNVSGKFIGDDLILCTGATIDPKTGELIFDDNTKFYYQKNGENKTGSLDEMMGDLNTSYQSFIENDNYKQLTFDLADYVPRKNINVEAAYNDKRYPNTLYIGGPNESNAWSEDKANITSSRNNAKRFIEWITLAALAVEYGQDYVKIGARNKDGMYTKTAYEYLTDWTTDPSKFYYTVCYLRDRFDINFKELLGANTKEFKAFMNLFRSCAKAVLSSKRGGILTAKKGVVLSANTQTQTNDGQEGDILDILKHHNDDLLNFGSYDNLKQAYKANEKIFNGFNMTWQDWVRVFSLGVDIGALTVSNVPLYGTIASGVMGLGSMALDAVADFSDDSISRSLAWKNVGINTGMAVLGMLPEGKSAHIAQKAVKMLKRTILPLANWALPALAVYGIANDAATARFLKKVGNGDFTNITREEWLMFYYSLKLALGLGTGIKRRTAGKKYEKAIENGSGKTITAYDENGVPYKTKETPGTKQNVEALQRAGIDVDSFVSADGSIVLTKEQALEVNKLVNADKIKDAKAKIKEYNPSAKDSEIDGAFGEIEYYKHWWSIKPRKKTTLDLESPVDIARGKAEADYAAKHKRLANLADTWIGRKIAGITDAPSSRKRYEKYGVHESDTPYDDMISLNNAAFDDLVNFRTNKAKRLAKPTTNQETTTRTSTETETVSPSLTQSENTQTFAAEVETAPNVEVEVPRQVEVEAPVNVVEEPISLVEPISSVEPISLVEPVRSANVVEIGDGVFGDPVNVVKEPVRSVEPVVVETQKPVAAELTNPERYTPALDAVANFNEPSKRSQVTKSSLSILDTPKSVNKGNGVEHGYLKTLSSGASNGVFQKVMDSYDPECYFRFEKINSNTARYEYYHEESAAAVMDSEKFGSYVRGAVEVIGRSPNKIETVEPGTIEKINGKWKITNKAKITIP